MTRSHRALAVVRPEGTLSRQIDFVKPKIISDQKALQPRIDSHVVEVIHRADAAAAVVYRSFELKQEQTQRQQSSPYR